MLEIDNVLPGKVSAWQEVKEKKIDAEPYKILPNYFQINDLTLKLDVIKKNLA